MSARLTAINPSQAIGKSKELLDAINTKLKSVPNMMRIMASSPSVLQAYLAFSDAMSHGALPRKLQHMIALTVAEANGCEYCLSAHTTIGKSLGLSEKEMQAAQHGKASDTKTEAALQFSRTVVTKRGNVNDSDINSLKNAGYSEPEIAEIIANISLSIFTNYFNIIAKTELDFPKATLIGEKIV